MLFSPEASIFILFRPVLPASSNPQLELRRQSLVLTTQTNRRKNSQELSPLSRRQNSAGQNNLLSTIRHRMSPKTSISFPSATDPDQNSSSPSSPNPLSPQMSNSIPIKSQQQNPQTSSSFFDYLSTSFSNRFTVNDQPQNTPKPSAQPPPTDVALPEALTSKKLWISDDDVSTCMCCNETQFSMFNRRHHCRRCGRVVCKTCSQHVTIIKNRPVRTCKDCYQQMQTNPTPSSTTTTSARPETNNQIKKFDNFRP